MKRQIQIGKKYRHFKGHLYRVIDIVNDSESKDSSNLDKVVIYQDLNRKDLKWARSYHSFASEVDHKKYPDVKQKYRFEEVDD